MKRILAALLFVVPLTIHAAPRPDVLVILTDQWSPRYVSWDNPQVRTPNLDRIAREGLIFDACYTPSPICMPARISLITGLYPHNAGHSVWGNVLNYHVPPASAPMFRDIRRAGHTTAQIGKLHWTAGATWREEFKTLADYYRALGLDCVEETREFLFDLGTDPLETRNLANDPAHRETLARMRGEMLLHLRSTQLNLGEGYKPKVQRMREAEASKEKTPTK